MTVMPNHALSTPFQLLSAFVVAVLIPACALPDSAMQNYAGASRLNQWNGVLDALGGSSVRRAPGSHFWLQLTNSYAAIEHDGTSDLVEKRQQLPATARLRALF